MTTKDPGEDPYVESATTVGSYGTFQENVAFGTGIFSNGYSLDMRYSNLTTDGYIRNGWCKHQSLFATLNKRFKTSNLRINYIYGSEHTGITWEGISEDQMKKDPTYNPAGEISDGIYYNNQSDNYRQQYLQAFYTQELNKDLLLNAGLNYTNGFGYYEEYKKDQTFSSMNLSNQTIDHITYDVTDLVSQKCMRNDFYTANLNLKYQKNGLNIQVGSMYTYYDGDHYGKLAWIQNNQNIPDGYEWVRNNGKKTDANFFAKTEYSPVKNLNVYLDLQYRYVNYILKGIDDDDMLDLTQKRTWNFFNPKAGVFYQTSPFQKVFASVAVAHREPARADIKDEFKSGNRTKIEAEKLTDYELGYTYDNQIYMASANVYYMNYNNQLVPTGKLNDVGYKLMSNVDKSYRLGLELAVGLRPLSWLQFDANTALSRNRVEDYTVWYTTYDNNSSNGQEITNQLSQYFKEAKLPFSPEMVSAIGVKIIPIKNFAFNLTEKQVGKQYITNTQNEDLTLPAYDCTNASLTYNFKIKTFANAEIGLYVNNLFSNQYSCNAWGDEVHYANGDPTYTEKGLYPVAPINYLTKFTVCF
jgi:iron complex outermembrane receptor protein